MLNKYWKLVSRRVKLILKNAIFQPLQPHFLLLYVCYSALFLFFFSCKQILWINNAAAAAKSLQSCLTLCNPIDGRAPGSPVPGILQARTLVCCHFLLQYMKVKSESEVTLSCQTPSDPMGCSLPGCTVHRIFQARVLEWVAIAFSRINNEINF